MLHSNLLVIGLGHVGLSWASYLTGLGHKIYGVELSEDKLQALQSKRLPFLEGGVAETLFKDPDHFHAQCKIPENLRFEAAFLCTPLADDHDFDNLLTLVRSAAEVTDCIYIKSTLPIKNVNRLLPLIQDLAGKKVYVAYLPEFFREGAASEDILQGNIVIGSQSDVATQRLQAILKNRTVYQCRPGEAVALKLACNAWHGLKVTFANEVHQICNELGEASDQVMELFCLDRRLNISESYLQPGPPFGGYCLPKDIGFINQIQQSLPIMNAIVESNNRLIEKITQKIASLGLTKIYWYGRAFKPHTDDTRNSISQVIAHQLQSEGFDVTFVDDITSDSINHTKASLLVLGPKELKTEQQNWIILNKLAVFDLGYFRSNRNRLGDYQNYESY